MSPITVEPPTRSLTGISGAGRSRLETPHVRTVSLLQSPFAVAHRHEGVGDARVLSRVHDQLHTDMHAMRASASTRHCQLLMAVDEAVNNAVYHGNLELSSALKEPENGNRFMEEAADRFQQAPWANRRISVETLVCRVGTWVTIRNEGPGFEPSAALACADDPARDLASGRGLTIMRAFTDELFFFDQGRAITLVAYYTRRDRILRTSSTT